MLDGSEVDGQAVPRKSYKAEGRAAWSIWICHSFMFGAPSNWLHASAALSVTSLDVISNNTRATHTQSNARRRMLSRLVDADVQRRDGRKSLGIRALGGGLHLDELAERRQFRLLRLLRRRRVGRALLAGSLREGCRDLERHCWTVRESKTWICLLARAISPNATPVFERARVCARACRRHGTELG